MKVFVKEVFVKEVFVKEVFVKEVFVKAKNWALGVGGRARRS